MGRPPEGGGHRPLKISIDQEVSLFLKKYKEGKIGNKKTNVSELVEGQLRVLARQFDPGPSSQVAIGIHNLIRGAIRQAVDEDDPERASALSYLYNRIKPALEPFLIMSEAEGEAQTGGAAVVAGQSEAFKENQRFSRAVLAADVKRALRKTHDMLSRAKEVLLKLPGAYSYRYAETLDRIASMQDVIMEFLDGSVAKEGVSPDEKAAEEGEKFHSPYEAYHATEPLSSMERFRRDHGSTIELILEKAESIRDDAKRLPRNLGNFIIKACDLVEKQLKRAWSTGLRLELVGYKCEEVQTRHGRNVKVIAVVGNPGSDDVSVSGVRVEGTKTVVHIRPNPVRKSAFSTVEFDADVYDIEGKAEELKVTVISGFAEFAFRIRPGTTIPPPNYVDAMIRRYFDGWTVGQ